MFKVLSIKDRQGRGPICINHFHRCTKMIHSRRTAIATILIVASIMFTTISAFSIIIPFLQHRHYQHCDHYRIKNDYTNCISHLQLYQQQPSQGRIKTLPYRTKDPVDIERSILLLPLKDTKKKTTTTRRHSSTTTKQYQFVIGTDESGTGCIAGPIIVVSCCILQPLFHHVASGADQSHQHDTIYTPFPKVMDCKALSAQDCAHIYQHVVQHPERYAYTVAYIYPKEMMNQTTTTASTTSTIPKLISNAMANTIEQLIEDRLLSQMVNAVTEDNATVPQKPNSTPSPIASLGSSKLPLPKIFSIVDGHRSIPPTAFQKYTITSRPYKSGDEYVYTIALASCLARHLHESYMQQVLHVQYPQYHFDIHGGYPTQQHLQAIHTYGIITSSTTTTIGNVAVTDDVHRLSCQPIQRLMSSLLPTNTRPLMNDKYIDDHDANDIKNKTTPPVSAANVTTSNRMSRQTFLSSTSSRTFSVMGTLSALFSTSIVQPTLNSNAMYIDKTNGISYPNVGEIETAVPIDWNQVDNPFTGDGVDTASLFTRLDTTNDDIFYNAPRFVEHIDDTAVQTITQYIDDILRSVPNDADAAASTKRISCLDLCASWTSHTSIVDRSRYNIVGLGMNEKELQANAALTEYVVRDLNDGDNSAVLPFPSESFDIVLCQLSIDYLIKPFEVGCEIARVLKNRTGRVYIFFSNRSFISKAVAVWTGKDDIDHTFIVASYLHYCNEMSPSKSKGTEIHSPSLFSDIQAQDLSKRTKSGRIIGDPLYVVSATKAKL